MEGDRGVPLIFIFFVSMSDESTTDPPHSPQSWLVLLRLCVFISCHATRLPVEA